MVAKIFLTVLLCATGILICVYTDAGIISIPIYFIFTSPLLLWIWPRKSKKQKERSGFSAPAPQRARTAGHEFEYWCAGYLLQHGFRKAAVTRASGDFGADIEAEHADGSRWVVQCKLYSKPVGNSAVQEVLAAKRHYCADRALVMTNTRLTKAAKILAYENEVAIIENLGR